MQAVGGSIVQKLNANKIANAMKALGYEPRRSNGRRGYLVVAYKPEEIEMNRRMLAYDARSVAEGNSDTSDASDAAF